MKQSTRNGDSNSRWLAILVESSALARGFNAQADEEAVTRARSVDDFDEAEAWLKT